MLRLGLVRRMALPKLIGAVRRTPAYLRHAPPGMYVTCDFERSQRHTTLLVDASVEGEPPLTNGVYLLSTTSGDDVAFRQARSALIGLPFARDAAQAAHFVDSTLRSALTRSGASIPVDGIETLVIPELHPFAAHAVKELLAHMPQMKVACSPLAAAFLSDGDFFAGVRKAMCDNDTRLAEASITFADVPQRNIISLEDGATVSVAGEDRQLRVASGDLTVARERWRRERKNKLKHFESYALFLYDPAFYAVLAGPSAGVHFSWLPFVVHEADVAALLPLPDFLASHKSGVSPLLEVWRPREQARVAATALAKFPEAQRVLTACYGEVSGGADGYLERLQQSAQKLEELRSRLGRRLAAETSRDMGRWSSVLEDKIMKEILFTNTAAMKTEEAVAAAHKEWASNFYLSRLSRSLAYASATLSPDTSSDDTRQTAAVEAKSSSSSPSSATVAGRREKQEGADSMQLLKRHLEKRGMASLSSIVEREEIDVPVFLAMSPDDFKKVFKATFGVIKKMELLQQELRALQ